MDGVEGVELRCAGSGGKACVAGQVRAWWIPSHPSLILSNTHPLYSTRFPTPYRTPYQHELQRTSPMESKKPEYTTSAQVTVGAGSCRARLPFPFAAGADLVWSI